jgi:hypothetical protein
MTWIIFLLGVGFLGTSFMQLRYGTGGSGRSSTRGAVMMPCPPAMAPPPVTIIKEVPVTVIKEVPVGAVNSAEAKLDEEKAQQLLAGSYHNEAFRLERKRIIPSVDKWSFCAPVPAYAGVTMKLSEDEKKAAIKRMADEAAEAGKGLGVNATVMPLFENPLCQTAEFFVVHNQAQNGESDNVVAYLEKSEQHVMDVFSAVLSTNLKAAYSHLGGTKALRPNDKAEGFVTAGHFPAEERKRLVVFDIGSNHGFFTLYSLGSASQFLTAFAFEPQPECAGYVRSALQMSGFSHKSLVFNNLAGDAKLATSSKPDEKATLKTLWHGGFQYWLPPASAETVDIPIRTGCRGTFPQIKPEELGHVKNFYLRTIGVDLTEKKQKVGYIDPASVLPSTGDASKDPIVLLTKIDVEGFEDEVLDALEPLMKAGRIANIVMEINKSQKLRRKGGIKEEEFAGWQIFHDPFIVEWVATIIRRMQQHGYVVVPSWGGHRNQVPLGTDEASLKAFADSGFNSVDVWAYLPEDKVAGLKKENKK